MAVGLFAIISSLADWDYFFNSRKAQFFLNLFGRKGTRIFYSVFGAGLFIVGFLLSIGIIPSSN